MTWLTSALVALAVLLIPTACGSESAPHASPIEKVRRYAVHGYYSDPSDEDVTLMANTVWGEARGEGLLGMRAVAHVIANRMRDPRYGDTVKSVVEMPRAFMGFRRRVVIPKSRVGDRIAYEDAVKISYRVLKGTDGLDPTGGATGFNRIAPRSAKHQSRIGNHVFFRN